MFKRGDQVEIIEEFQDAGDSDFTWVAIDDEEKGRVTIMPIDHPMHLKPTYVVEAAWLRHAA